MNLRQILSPNRHNRFIWLNALTLLALLLFKVADPFALVMVYFMETIIIGFFHAFKMYYVGRYGHTQQYAKTKNPVFATFFFLLHYSFFVAVQSIFVFAIFQFGDPNIKEPFNLIANYSYVLTLKGIGYGLLSMFIFLLIQNYFGFFRNRVYDLVTVDYLFFQPYLRIFIQQFTVILGMFFIALGPSGMLAAMLLILIRLFVDLVGAYIGSSEKNKRMLARKLARKTEQSEEEILEEFNKMF